MARYDLYPNPFGEGYLLDVQSNLLDELSTRVVVPVVPIGKGDKVVRRLNPSFVVDGKSYALFTHHIGSISVSQLGSPKMNLLDRHDDVVKAFDMLFHGF